MSIHLPLVARTSSRLDPWPSINRIQRRARGQWILIPILKLRKLLALLGMTLTLAGQASRPIPTAEASHLISRAIDWHSYWDSNTRTLPTTGTKYSIAALQYADATVYIVPQLSIVVTAYADQAGSGNAVILAVDYSILYQGTIEEAIKSVRQLRESGRNEPCVEIGASGGGGTAKQGGALPMLPGCRPPGTAPNMSVFDFRWGPRIGRFREEHDGELSVVVDAAKSWLFHYRPGTRAKLTVPAFASIDPVVYTLFEGSDGSTGILVVRRDAGGSLVVDRLLERRSTTEHIRRLISARAPISFKI